MEGQQHKIDHLQERRQVQIMDAVEWGRGAGYEDANLIDGIIGRVERAEVLKGRFPQWEKQCWSHTLVYHVLSDVDQ
jgi:hypothetical protein